MRARRSTLAALVAAGAVAAMAAPATAATAPTRSGPTSAEVASAVSTAKGARTTSAHLVGPVVVDPRNPRVGYVTAVYRCFGQGALWVSVKQTKDRSKDPRLAQEGSSAIAEAWSDSHRNQVTCNGKVQVQVFTVDQEEPFGPPPEDENAPPPPAKSTKYGPLQRGFGWVQFCLFDDQHQKEPYSENRFRPVVALGHR